MIVTIMIMIMIAMLIDRDTPAVCAANSGADARRIATRTDDRNGSYRDSAVERQIGCHRMRARGLQNLLDQKICLGIDDA